MNEKNRLNYLFGYQYIYTPKITNNILYLNLEYILKRYGYKKSVLEFNNYFEDNNIYEVFDWRYTYGRFSKLSYMPFRYKEIKLFLQSDYQNMLGAGYKIDYLKQMSRSWFLSVSSKAAILSNNDIYIGNFKPTLGYVSDFDYNNTHSYNANYAIDFHGCIKKAFNINWYNYTFIFSLRRGAMYIKTQLLFSNSINMNESSIGIELETLLIHKEPIRINFKVYNNSSNTNTSPFALAWSINSYF